jgi:hypothetical protein
VSICVLTVVVGTPALLYFGCNAAAFGLLLSVAVVVCLWLLATRPESVALLTVFVVILAYERTAIVNVGIGGPGNRGAVSLADVLWVLLMVRMFMISGAGTWLALLRRLHGSILLLAPYTIASVVLPVLGILTMRWPAHFALPGLRQVQWLSFGLIMMKLARRLGMAKAVGSFSFVVGLAALLHLIYSCIQYAASTGAISGQYLILDGYFIQTNQMNWFFYPRVTGFLVNPNSYGLFGAVVLTMLMARIVSGVKTSFLQYCLWSVSAGYAVVLSSSRTALLAAVGGSVFVLAAGGLLPRLRKRASIALAGLLCMALLGVVAVSQFAPNAVGERAEAIVKVLSRGAEQDSDMLDRKVMWRDALIVSQFEYPFGTWVSPGYANGRGIDSYYIMALVQGTILYTASFGAFLAGCSWLGLACTVRSSKDCHRTFAGLSMVGLTAILAIASVSLSPILEPHFVCAFWCVIGLCCAAVLPQHATLAARLRLAGPRVDYLIAEPAGS